MPRWGLQSPFLFVPLWGTLLFPNHGPGLQSWKACGPDEQEVTVGKGVYCGGADGWGKNFVFLRKIYAKWFCDSLIIAIFARRLRDTTNAGKCFRSLLGKSTGLRPNKSGVQMP